MEHRSPWSEVYAWFWMNEQEILHGTQSDFDEKARQFRMDGATIVIDFSLTHYRLAFVPYFEKIHAGIRMLADACHKEGLRLIEHHSASLVFDLLWSEGWKRLEADIGSFSNWKSDVYSWIEVPRYLISEPMLYGKPLRSMFQIDGRTGEKASSVYDSDCLCYNNPDYRAAYFAYMKELIDCGIDGIMNDDVQYFGDGNACTCVHCRKKFREQTGYDLPQPEGWSAFYGDYSNPAFIAWERFKRESTRDFYHDLSAWYRSLGATLLRPNYVSAALEGNPTSYGFDTCCDIWDNIYQENCFSTVMKASYPDYMIEAVHRFAAAARRGVASMSQFYPDRADTVYFGWALSRAWGQLYTGTCEGVNITQIERKYREFERAHAAFYDQPVKLRDVSFYFSKQTRDYTEDAARRYQRPFMAALQAACFSGLITDMVFEEDDAARWRAHPRIVCSHTAMLSDAELSRFADYVRAGGTLILLGDFAVYDEHGNARDYAKISEGLGLSAQPERAEAVTACTIRARGREITLPRIMAKGKFQDQYYYTEQIGAGSVFWAPFDMGCDEYQPSVWADRRQETPRPVPAHPSRRALQAQYTGALLDLLVEKTLRVQCEQKELFASAFNTRGGIAVHLVNLSDTVPEDGRPIGHEERIQNFTEQGRSVPEVCIALRTDRAVSRAWAYTPEKQHGAELAVRRAGEDVQLTLPAGFFAGYALITMEE